MKNNQRNISIVLTGTIIPNVKINSLYNDSQKRKEEYLKCIKYYTQFSKVYFLENSIYPIENDPDFQNVPNLTIRKFPSSSHPERGKGFQEFKMLDDWILHETDNVENFIKITGRYFYPCFADIWQECQTKIASEMIINQYVMSQAGVELFFTTRNFYKNVLLNLYLDSDDRKGINIDMCVYKKLKSVNQDLFQRFYSNTTCIGFSGTDGKVMDNKIRDLMNNAIRKVNYLLDKRYIWLSF